MWTTFDIELIIPLTAVVSFVLGGIVTGLLLAKADETVTKQVEASGMWRIKGRAYRLVRSPGLDELSKS